MDAAKIAVERAQKMLDAEAGSVRGVDEAKTSLALAEAAMATARLDAISSVHLSESPEEPSAPGYASRSTAANPLSWIRKHPRASGLGWIGTLT